MAVNEEWGRQLRAARRSYEERHDTRLSYAEIGRRVSARLGREPFSATSARAWFVEGQEPETFAIAEAIAYVLEADPGALAFPNAHRPAVAQIGPPPGMIHHPTMGNIPLNQLRPVPEPVVRPVRKTAGERKRKK